MARKSKAEAGAATGGTNGLVEISAFGGHLLTAVPARPEAVIVADPIDAALAELGLTDAEQVVAAAAVPDVSEEFRNVLGLDDQTFQEWLHSAVEALPPDRAELVGRPAEPDLALGALLPTDEMIAAAEATVPEEAVEAEPVALPPAVNLIPYLPAIRSQASRGTCVSFTLTALNEYVLHRRGLVRDLSEQHLYYEIKLIDGSADTCGTWQNRAVTALQTSGQCREQVWPYNPNPPCNNHGSRPAAARSDGLGHRLATVAVPSRNVAEYKTQLARQRPVTLSFPVYNSWYQSAETRRSGRITMRIGNEPVAGGHAVCLVGYQETASSPGGGYFIVRNSWGTTWASQSPYGRGYGTIPYQYITNDAYEAYTAVVPGIGGGDQDEDRNTETPSSSVTIEVGRNVKITIKTE
ncbi:C1 family peptidase [Rhodococcus sp. NPDC003348]